MWDRKELKARGKAAFQANYLRAVIAALVLALVTGAAFFTASNNVNSAVQNSVNSSLADSSATGLTEEQETALNDFHEQFQRMSEEEQMDVALILGSILLGAALVSWLIHTVLDVFLFNPLEAGCQRFFLKNTDEPATLPTLLYAFQNRYGKTVLTLFLRDLFLLLWGLLFLIPAFVKAYSYRLVPFILSDNPDISPKEAITLSRRMMDGHKWSTFVLDLSFLGWNILSAITLGLVGVFYAFPYEYATGAELYKTIRDNFAKVELTSEVL